MAEQKLGSVNISGAGSASGGAYEKVSISGSGKISGDVEAQRIRITGSGKVQGNTKAGSVHTSGSARFDGNLEADEFKCSGSCKVAGSVVAKTAHCSGAVNVRGGMKAGHVQISGAGSFGGDVEAEHFRTSGSFKIDGLLNADQIEVALGGEARVREIGGEQITIIQNNAPTSGWLSRFFCQPGHLTTETIEGDDIYLEGTTTQVARGRRVKIGPGCVIDNVEYSEALEIDPATQVKESRYTGTESIAPQPLNQTVSRPDGWAKGPKTGDWQFGINHPVGKIIGAFIGLLIAALVIGGVVFLVLPAVGLLVGVVLAGVALLLLVLAVVLPIMIFGAAFWEILKPSHWRRR